MSKTYLVECSTKKRKEKIQELVKNIKFVLKTPKNKEFVKSEIILERALDEYFRKHRGGRIW